MRFYRRVLIGWLVIVALIGGMLLDARAASRPGDLQGLGFGMCDGRPCFMGITPGLTTLPDAMAYLEKNGGRNEALGFQYSVGERRVQYALGELTVILDYSPETLVVQTLNVMLPGVAVQVKVGDVVRYWGLPCGFSRESMRFTRFVLAYPYLYLDLGYADQWIGPGTWVHSIGINPSVVPCDGAIPWHGFVQSEWYQNWEKR